MNINLFIAKVGLVFTLLSTCVSANLLIYPVRVSFDEIERTQEVNLTNTSSKITTYRLQWLEKKPLRTGGYQAVTENEAQNMPIASSMLRFSPREVTLKPRERQLIKLRLRRPRDLVDGEYRSHLLFKAMPPKRAEDNSNQTGTMIDMVMSFAIPLTIQQGKYDSHVSLQAAIIEYKVSDGSRKVSLELLRTGMHSSSGDISAYWKPNNSATEVLLAKRADYNFWAELSESHISLVSTEAKFSPSDGRLRIHYEGSREFRGNTYLDEIIYIKQNQIVLN